jgi:two-component system response regulator HupR/HoxA
MQALYRELAAAAVAPAPILLLGETGVGKEHLARLVHAASSRAGEAFVAVNCAAIPSDLLEAELFGVVDGAATGVQRRTGLYRQADGGTVLLDEVGDLEPRLQAKLLRALQEGEVRPVGGRAMKVDVRVVAATHADLEARRRAGSFRDDLYYRLAGFVLRVPPLRRRPEDVAPLVEHFVARFCAEAGRSVELPPRVMELLRHHPWPGNVRQLENEVRRLVYLTPDGCEVAVSSLSSELLGGRCGLGGDGLDGGVDVDEPILARDDLDLTRHVERLEARLLRRALARTGGSIAPAARLAGLSRNGFKAKCRRHGIRL